MKGKIKKQDHYRIIVILFIGAILTGFIFLSKGSKTEIPADLKWSERMALSVMQRNPKSWQLEFNESPKWSYTHGLVLSSFLELYEKTRKSEYYDYVEEYVDTMVQEDGSILTYEIEDFNIDHLNAGNLLLAINEKNPEEKYQKALKMLRKQIQWQPRTTEGGFWHKLRYPWQMWLDGLYMGSPFYARYSLQYGELECLDDIFNQFIIMEKHARDSITGLLYHGWDESRVQRWADEQTGRSENFWGRAMGWYAMGLVDVLDELPENYPRRSELVAILNRLVDALIPYQDESGLWYQVIDKKDAKGNYLEGSASCMFTYAIAKGVNKGYLDERYKTYAKKCFDGIINYLVKIDDKGGIHITNVCSVAGLGGRPYRDGSFEYYISEPKRDNDPKATGPFILASLELDE